MIKTKEEAIARVKHSIELKRRWIEESDRRLKGLKAPATFTTTI